MAVRVSETSIAGLLMVEPVVLHDSRGFLLETQKESALVRALGRPHRFAQANHSRSLSGTLRGFHKEGWDKLIYVVRGTALCAVGDSRPESPTFGKSLTFLLGDPPGARRRLFVSEGLCNAFWCLTDVDYYNDVSGEYDAKQRGGVRWNDPTFAVAWPGTNPLLSETDLRLPTLREVFPDHPMFRTAEPQQTDGGAQNGR